MTATSKVKKSQNFLAWLDILAITAWAILMLKYWLTNQLNLLIHPDFFWLVISGAIGLLIVALIKAMQLRQRHRVLEVNNVQHFSIFPPGWGSGLILTTAILGFLIKPTVFSSQNALDRGVTELIGATRAQPQQFRPSTRPEERTLIDWVRTLNVYPEPDAYTGQKVKVKGFVIHPPEIENNYLFLAQFILTCCAADAYPAGLPVKLPESRDAYSPDTWLEVEGQMITENLLGRRKLTIEAKSVKRIPQPENPYGY